MDSVLSMMRTARYDDGRGSREVGSLGSASAQVITSEHNDVASLSVEQQLRRVSCSESSWKCEPVFPAWKGAEQVTFPAPFLLGKSGVMRGEDSLSLLGSVHCTCVSHARRRKYKQGNLFASCRDLRHSPWCFSRKLRIKTR